jgi:hypothetical protein
MYIVLFLVSVSCCLEPQEQGSPQYIQGVSATDFIEEGNHNDKESPRRISSKLNP